MRQKPIFDAFAPRGEKGSRERLKRLAEVLPDNTWNKTSLKIKNVHIGLTQQIVIWRADFCSGHCRGGY